MAISCPVILFFMLDHPGHDKTNTFYNKTEQFYSFHCELEGKEDIELYLIIIESEMERLKRMRDIVNARLTVFPEVRRRSPVKIALVRLKLES